MSGLLIPALATGLTAALLLAPASHAQTGDPGFRPMRYEEDWRALCTEGPASSVPRYKCIRLTADADLSVGGDIRERAEFIRRGDFGLGREKDAVLLHRAMVHANLRMGSRLRAFAEIGYFDASGRDDPVPPTDVNRFDVTQAFIDWTETAGDFSFTARLGRQEMGLGSARLISIRGGPNVRRALDGARFNAKGRNWQTDAFYLHPVDIRRGAFDDRTDRHEVLWGVYGSAALTERARADIYFLGYERAAAQFASIPANEDRRSLGARLSGRASALDWDWEAVIQDGRFGQQKISAWTVATETGYTFSSDFTPRVSLKADIASGDRDPMDNRLGTFNAIYPRLNYFSEVGLIAPANLMDLQPDVTVRPIRALSLSAAWNGLWRHRVQDSVFASPQRALTGTAGLPGRYIGQQAILSFRYDVSTRLTLSGQYVHFRPGSALRSIGGEPGNFLMVEAGVRF